MQRHGGGRDGDRAGCGVMAISASEPDPLSLPTCAKCNRSVESLVSTRDFLGNRFVFRVFCHGETEETVLTEFLLMQMGGQDGIQAGVAFRDKAALPALEEVSS